jgi:predicted permease
VCVQLLLSCFLGAIAAITGVIKPKDRQTLQTFVFCIALPLLVLRGVSTRVDFYDNTLYPFVGVFLVIRFATLLVSVAVVLGQRALKGNTVDVVRALHTGHKTPTLYSQICELWLSLSWMSTVVIGLPVLTAALTDEKAALKLSLQAAISSFIFQLPCLITLLETHVEKINTTNRDQRNVYRRVGRRLVRNPVLWAIMGGIVLSTTHTGTWINNTRSCVFLSATMASFASCVTPIGMFVTGAWIAHRNGLGENLWRRSRVQEDNTQEEHVQQPLHQSTWSFHLLQIVLVLLGKLVLVPLVALGLAKLLKLPKDEIIGVTLTASLPVSVASVVVTERHGASSDLVAAQVICGILLLLPTASVWCVVLDV